MRVTLQLPAELERIILEDVQRGPYRSIDEFLEQAVRLLLEQEDWLASQRAAIAKLVEAGWESAACGKLRVEAEVREVMEERNAPGKWHRWGRGFRELGRKRIDWVHVTIRLDTGW
jgi:Arc/MetJ-type ribon-helix-helix transcriptional regulator